MIEVMAPGDDPARWVLRAYFDGVATVRLDTRRDLTEARRLYARHGYREVRPSSHGRYVDHSYEKALC